MVISKINGVAWANVSKIDGVAKASISKVNTVLAESTLMEITITTTSSPQDYKLYLVGANGLKIEWGDTGSDTYTGSDGVKTHSYATAGTYTVKATAGTATRIAFGETSCTPTLVNTVVKPFSVSLGLTSTYKMFEDCRLTSWVADFFDAASAGITFADRMFYGCNINEDLSGWNTGNITSMVEMFRMAELFNQNIGAWDVSKVLEFASMFYGALAFNNGGSDSIKNWNTVNCTNMFSMFTNCNFNQPIGDWDVGNVIYLGYMFYRVAGLGSFDQDLSAWRPLKCTYFAYMFMGSSLFNHPVNDWGMGAATNLQSMFHGALAFNQDVSGWDVRNVTNATNFLSGSAFSQTNYDLLLVAWEAQAVQNNVKLHAGSAKYGSGAPATARAALIADHTWTITDGGPA